MRYSEWEKEKKMRGVGKGGREGGMGRKEGRKTERKKGRKDESPHILPPQNRKRTLSKN